MNEKYNVIKVVGHKNPDIDSILSGIIFEYYGKLINKNFKYVISDKKVPEDNLEILNYLNINYEKYFEDIEEEDKLILLDHHSTNYKNLVLGCIDHHPEFYKDNKTLNIKASSTAKIIYDYLLKDFKLPDKIMKMIILSILVDTSNFRSSKAVISDKEFVKNMCILYNFDLIELEKLGDCLTNINNEQCIFNGKKEYIMENKKVLSSYIQVKNISSIEIDKILQMIKKIDYKNYYLWFFLIFDIGNNSTILYEFYNNIKEEHKYNKVLSRGNDIIPYLEKKHNTKLINC